MITIKIVDHSLSTHIRHDLLNFVISKADMVSFTSLHDYYLSETQANLFLQSYKKDCKTDYAKQKELCENKEETLWASLRENNIFSKEDADQFFLKSYQDKMILCQNMEQIQTDLCNSPFIHKSYYSLSNYLDPCYLNYHVQQKNNYTTTLYPVDIIFYKISHHFKEFFCLLPSLFHYNFEDRSKNIAFFDATFYKEKNVFGHIHTSSGQMYLTLSMKEYANFKKLKIKHERVKL